MNSLNTVNPIETRLDRIEHENAQLKSQFKHERRRYRIQATLGLAALGCALFFSPGNRAAFADTTDELMARIAALEAKTQYVSVDTSGDMHITGTNLHVENGTGQTETANGKGNLILGYNYSRTQFNDNSDNRTGSHYLVLGDWNNYTQHGGIVGGEYNQADGTCASVLGGSSNRSEGYASVVVGGYSNQALGDRSAIVSGERSQASGTNGVVLGGYANTASGSDGAVLGGYANQATGEFSAASAGLGNFATGRYASVSGGYNNYADGVGSSVCGGYNNYAEGTAANVKVFPFGDWTTISGGHQGWINTKYGYVP